MQGAFRRLDAAGLALVLGGERTEYRSLLGSPVSAGCRCDSGGAVEAQQLRWRALAPNYQLPRFTTLSLRGRRGLTSTRNRHADAWFCTKPAWQEPALHHFSPGGSQQKTRRSGSNSLILLEARTGIEPMWTALQAVRSPALARVSGPLPLGLPVLTT